MMFVPRLVQFYPFKPQVQESLNFREVQRQLLIDIHQKLIRTKLYLGSTDYRVSSISSH